MIRREGYESPVTIVSADSDLPVDRPNLSKDYLAGEAQDDWMPIWSKEQYDERKIDSDSAAARRRSIRKRGR